MKPVKRHFKVALLSALAVLSSCATIAPPQPPSLNLPKPSSDLRAARKGDKVTLTWSVPTSTTDRQTIRNLGPTRICRAPDLHLNECGTPVGEAPPTVLPAPGAGASKPKLTATYVDVIPAGLEKLDPSAQITYTVQVLNASGRGGELSNQAHVSAVPTLPPPQAVRAEVTKDGVVLRWTLPPPLSRPPPAAIVYRVRVYRRQEGSQANIKLADLAYPSVPDSFLDQTFAWESAYYYHLAVVTAVAEPGKPEAAVEGDDSPEVKVFARDIFPPAVPASLQAVFSGPGQKAFIDLIWAPVTDADLAGYNLYRHEGAEDWTKVNAEPLKTPAYRDSNVEPGRKYFYSVSAVDIRGNESVRSDEASESAP
jgi:hypothetical protein